MLSLKKRASPISVTEDKFHVNWQINMQMALSFYSIVNSMYCQTIPASILLLIIATIVFQNNIFIR